MAEKDWLLGETPNPLGERVDEIRAKLREQDPEKLAARTGALFTPKGSSGGEFRLAYWSREVILSFPEFTGTYAESGEALSTFDLTMLAYYFEVCDGTRMSNEWIAFNQIPGGLFYAQAFQGYSGDELAKVFGNDAEAFMNANEQLGGRREFFGNVSYSYQVLPRVPIMVVCWLGDEEFPSSYRMLFDSNAHRHLVTDAYAILGSHLVRRLIKAKN
ncbi:MAG TPA: hypothetical protein DEH25_05365 [Chloroflexi bacterium]|nr:hypothetical protein [Chloroflexota bacterium]